MALIHNVTNIFVVYHLFIASAPTIESHNQVYKSVLLQEFEILILIACFFNLIALVFLGHLTIFHIMLQKRGLTTYEYIRLKAKNTRASKIVKRKETGKDVA